MKHVSVQDSRVRGDHRVPAGAHCGSVALAEGRFWASDNTIVCKPVTGEPTDLRFLSYLLEAMKLNRLAAGSAQPLLTQKVLKPLEVPWPSTQIRMAVAIRLQTFDDLIENNRRRIEILEEMARLLYSEWFVHFRFPGHEYVEMADSKLGPIPKGWEVAKLSEVLTLSYGKALKAGDRRGGAVEVYGSGGLVGYHDERLVDGPGIVVGRKGNVGALYWIDADFYPIDTTYFVKTDLPLYCAFQMLGTLTFIDSHAAVPGLSRDQAYGLDVVVPESTLYTDYEAKVRAMVDLRRNLIQQNLVLSEARDLLLPRLVSGELDVSDLDLGELLA